MSANFYPGPRGFLDFAPHEKAAREPRSSEHESRSGEKEKPLVTLDLNLTFMQMSAVKCVKLKGPMATQQAHAYQPLAKSNYNQLY